MNDDPLLLARDSEPKAANTKDTDDWVLLATWLCGQEVRWLDSGVVSWMIRRQGLTGLRFDRVYGHVEMGGRRLPAPFARDGAVEAVPRCRGKNRPVQHR
ncbi:DUF1963 domain-containing protein [Streptomyces brasiliensis]|uniref:Uncharacterized protein n=1 Tax=Streptomyces brasiliensis TaxID=1954 RepID=A0A917L4N4_9ACTN|nr:DUF1963 domain-containing protein [Streptomyces brasiliensis]GGJ39675.1 hypothetical protein GCM10010121_058500 [Streptomyces brasiliensis]